MNNWRSRISGIYTGHPCIRNGNIRILDILDLMATGQSQDQILEKYPELEHEDINAVLKFAWSKLAFKKTPMGWEQSFNGEATNGNGSLTRNETLHQGWKDSEWTW